MKKSSGIPLPIRWINKQDKPWIGGAVDNKHGSRQTDSAGTVGKTRAVEFNLTNPTYIPQPVTCVRPRNDLSFLHVDAFTNVFWFILTHWAMLKRQEEYCMHTVNLMI